MHILAVLTESNLHWYIQRAHHISQAHQCFFFLSKAHNSYFNAPIELR